MTIVLVCGKSSLRVYADEMDVGKILHIAIDIQSHTPDVTSQQINGMFAFL